MSRTLPHARSRTRCPPACAVLGVVVVGEELHGKSLSAARPRVTDEPNSHFGGSGLRFT